LIATGDGLIGLPLYIWKSFTRSYRFAFIWDFSHLPSHISVYWNFFKQIGLEKNLWLLLVLQNNLLLLKKLLKFMNFNNKWSKDLVLGTGQKSLLLYPMEVFRNQRCNSFSLATEREYIYLVFNIY
jgi:hypothetical protein